MSDPASLQAALASDALSPLINSPFTTGASMKRTFLTLTALLFLASCKPDGNATADTAATAKPCPPAVAGYRFLPGRLDVPVAYHLRTDRITATNENQRRRRVTLEFLEGDVASVQASVEGAMAKAGYRARTLQEREDGSVTRRFIKRKGVGIIVIISPKVGDRPANPDAKGLLTYSYPLGPVPQSAASGSQSKPGS